MQGKPVALRPSNKKGDSDCVGQRYMLLGLRYAGIAQLAERWFCTPVVAGSIPATSSICWDGLMVERSSRTALASVRFRVPAPSGGGRDRRRNSFLAVCLHTPLSIDR